ncbi:MAG TPA: hypothetical protein PLA71_01060 [Saccharofermentans sp.]|nr:hypothetical protein [Saccharofermentans sp.]
MAKKDSNNFSFPKFDKDTRKKLDVGAADVSAAKYDDEKTNPLFIRSKRALKKFSQDEIRKLSSENVIEVVFTRRIWPIPFATRKPGQGMPSRRMLCSANWQYMADNAKEFKFRPPSGIQPRSKRWYSDRKLIIVHDLIRQNWRMISMDDYEVVAVYPLGSSEDKEKFLKYYEGFLKKNGRKKAMALFDR